MRWQHWLKWKVSEPPSGRYRSFDKRGWPTAHFAKDGRIAVALYADKAYSSQVKETEEITIRVAFWKLDGKGFDWKTLKARARGLSEAKQIASDFFAKHPEIYYEV